MALLNKLVKSSYNENKIDRRLAELSYSAINGERQEAKSYAPEGVVMPGQIDRERPLEAITKEMIKEYQESQAGPAAVIGGVPYMYRQSGMEPPKVKAPIEYQKFESEVDKLTQDRRDNAMEIKELEKIIKRLTNTEKKILFEINTFGDTPERLQALMKNKTDMLSLTTELKDAKTDADAIRLEIDKRQQLIDDIKKHNAIAVQENYGKIKEYETALQEANRDRMIIQQQPYESDYDYYNRLKEVEKQRYNPLLYKQISLNQNIVELKQKLPNLFKEEATIEGVIKSLSDDNKFLLNKHFGTVENLFKGQFGYNPSMSLNDIANILTDIIQQTNAATVLQGALKRPSIQKGYSRYLDAARAGYSIVGAAKAKKARQEARQEANFLAAEKITTDLENQIKQVQQDIQREKRRRPGLSTVSEADEAGLQRELDRLAEIQRQNEAEISNTYDTQVAREVVGRDGNRVVVMVPAIVNRETGEIRYKDDEVEGLMAQGREEARKDIAATKLQGLIRGKLASKREFLPITMQRLFRGYQGRKRVKEIRAPHEAELERIRNDPIIMPDLPYGETVEVNGKLITYPSYDEYRKMLEDQYNRRVTLASKINRIAKGHAERKYYKYLKYQYPKQAAARLEQIKALQPGTSLIATPIQRTEAVSITPEEQKRISDKSKYEKLTEGLPVLSMFQPEPTTPTTPAPLTREVSRLVPKSAAAKTILKAMRTKRIEKIKTGAIRAVQERAVKSYQKARESGMKESREDIVKEIAKEELQQAAAQAIAELNDERNAIIEETVADIANGVATEESKEAAAQAIAEIDTEAKKLKAKQKRVPRKAIAEIIENLIENAADIAETKPTLLQAAARGKLSRKQYKEKQSAARILQAATRRSSKLAKEYGQYKEQAKSPEFQPAEDIQRKRLFMTKQEEAAGKSLTSQFKTALAQQQYAQKLAAGQALTSRTRAVLPQQQYAQKLAAAQSLTSQAKAVLAQQQYAQKLAAAQSLAPRAKVALARKIYTKKLEDEKAAAIRQKMYDDAYNAAIAGGASAAGAAAIAAKTAGSVLGTVVGTTAGLAGSALTGIGRMAGFFKTQEEKDAEAAEAARQREEVARRREIAKQEDLDRQAKMNADLEAMKRKQQEADERLAQLLGERTTPSPPRRPSPRAALAREVSGFSTLSAATTVRPPSPIRVTVGPEIDPAEKKRLEERAKKYIEAQKRSPSPPNFSNVAGISEYRAADFNKMTSTQIKDIRDKLQDFVDKAMATPESKKDGMFLAGQKDALNALQRANNAYSKSKKEGRGLGLVKARKHKISPEEAMKNRLRLVVSQVQAGNTNPKLIVEVNRLYKKLYKIDNAYSLIKK